MKNTFKLLLSIITVFILSIGLMGLIYGVNEGGQEDTLSPSTTHSTIELSKSNIKKPNLSELGASVNDNEEDSNSENKEDGTDHNSNSSDSTSDNSSDMSSENETNKNESNQQDGNDRSDLNDSSQSTNESDNNQSENKSDSNKTTESKTSNNDSDSSQDSEKQSPSNEQGDTSNKNETSKEKNNNSNKESNKEQENQEKETKKTVTVSIIADEKMGTILAPTSVEIGEDETVLSTLIKVTQSKKIPMSYRGGNGSNAYVEGINNLFEFDRGSGSGWMFRINKIFPNRGAGVIPVRDGDRIEWLYTLDLGKDLGAELEPYRE